MYIGIFDQDIKLYPSKFVPSLELMKVSSFYKSKGDIVELCFDMNDFEKYDIVYLSRNSLSAKDFPQDLLSKANVEWVGRGFVGSYVQLSPEMEHQQADKTLYRNFINANKSIFSQHTLVNLIGGPLKPEAVLLRITDGNSLLVDYTTLPYYNQELYFYDYDFFMSPFAREVVEFFYNRECKLRFMECSVIDDIDLFRYCCGKVYPAHLMKQVMYLNYHPEYTLKFFTENEPYFSKHQGLYINQQEVEVHRKTFFDLANFYFYGVSKQKSIKFKDSPINKKDMRFWPRMIHTLCDFTQMTSARQSTTIMKRASQRSKVFYNILCNEVAKDPSLYKMCNTNSNIVYTQGVWRYV